VREPLIIVMKWKKHVQSNYFDYAKAGWGMVADGGDGLYVGVYCTYNCGRQAPNGAEVTKRWGFKSWLRAEL
jgi:hypothetical protein